MSSNDENLQDLTDVSPELAVMRREVVSGLGATPKYIPSLYFYDDTGSELFEQITDLPEYYLTRTEVSIMAEHAAEMAEVMGPGVRLVELGSGAAIKVGHLLEHLPELAAYVPVEISADHMMEASGRIAAEFPDVEVLPVCADFSMPFELPETSRPVRSNVAYFPGSTIGNFPAQMAEDLLGLMSRQMGPGGGMLIGIDLVKPVDIIEPAYNDAQGITSAFTLNLLTRLNRELHMDFDLDAYSHRSEWVPERSRIETFIISARDQTVHLGDASFEFGAGERMLVEYSHKYTVDGFSALASANGFRVEKVWTDPEDLFAVVFMRVS
jgi:dimethylhistidine N-methyltransferase